MSQASQEINVFAVDYSPMSSGKGVRHGIEWKGPIGVNESYNVAYGLTGLFRAAANLSDNISRNPGTYNLRYNAPKDEPQFHFRNLRRYEQALFAVAYAFCSLTQVPRK